ncbi:MAG: anti-sigma factor [Rhizobacter sp.]
MTSPIDTHRINAFIDGELDLTLQIDMEAGLEQDAGLLAQADGLRQLRSAVREQADYHEAPAALARRIRALGAPDKASAVESTLRRWFAWRPAVLAIGVASLLTWGVALTLSHLRQDEHLMQEAVASHVRATLGQRLVDVASSDQHTVKPWLSARLDFSPPVHDLKLPNVVFLGGRIDYLGGHPVAALVYKQREHVVDAFMWPTQESDSAVTAQSQRGFNARHWVHGGMRYWVVSDLNHDELATLAQALDR